MTKTILRALAGETLPTPPIWMMRQAGRYLPEYRALRADKGGFLALATDSDAAAEITAGGFGRSRARSADTTSITTPPSDS